MQQLWAPWRMGLLDGSQKPTIPSPSGCIFCDYPRAVATADDEAWDRERYIVATTPHAFVMLNRFPYINGHLLVVPRQHLGQLDELHGEPFIGLHELLRDAVAAVRKAYQPHALNVGMNLGEAAGAGIAAHLHYHVLPRWVGDTNFVPALFDVRVINEALDATWLRMREAFAAVRSTT